jgi:hypothetical protein
VTVNGRFDVTGIGNAPCLKLDSLLLMAETGARAPRTAG